MQLKEVMNYCAFNWPKLHGRGGGIDMKSKKRSWIKTRREDQELDRNLSNQGLQNECRQKLVIKKQKQIKWKMPNRQTG
jgi:hypothetical protein